MGRGRGTIKFWIFSGASSVQSRGSRGAREGAEARRGEEEKAERGSPTGTSAFRGGEGEGGGLTAARRGFRILGSGEVLCAEGGRYCFFWQTVIRDVP